MKYVFTRPQVGQTYGVFNALAGTVVELDPAYAAEGLESGLLAVYEGAEAEPVKPVKPAARKGR